MRDWMRRIAPYTKPALIYGAALASGTWVLAALDLLGAARLHTKEVTFSFVAVGFLALGVWLGAQMFGRRPAPTSFDGNPKAQAALGMSARELEVLRQLAAGLSNKEIAAKLGVSPNTVKTHVARLYEKLDARRRTEAILKARELGLLS